MIPLVLCALTAAALVLCVSFCFALSALSRTVPLLVRAHAWACVLLHGESEH
jgi:hypothetical protein